MVIILLLASMCICNKRYQTYNYQTARLLDLQAVVCALNNSYAKISTTDHEYMLGMKNAYNQ